MFNCGSSWFGRIKLSSLTPSSYIPNDDPAMFDIKESVQACAKEAKSFKDAGFRAVMIKVGLLSVEDDLKRVAAVIKAIGDDMKLMVDANHAYSLPTAVHLAK